MGLVRGEDVILSVQQYNGTENVYVPFGCARSVTFDISTDFIETSVTESGQFKTFLPSGKQYSGNIEGLVFLDKPASASIKATAILDYSDLIDAGVFPSFGDAFGAVTANDYNDGTITLGFTTSGTFANLTDFLTAINASINAGSTGYTSLISGNTLIISSRLNEGDFMNGRPCNSNNNFTSGPIEFETLFSGGITGYFPSKISLGWLYDKLIYTELIQLKYYEIDDDNHYLQKICNVYIESINETASFDNMVTFSASFKGNGTPTITYGEI